MQVDAAVFTSPGLVGGVLGRAAIGGVGEHQHGGAAEESLHDAKSSVGAHEQPLAHNGRWLAGSAAVGIGHYGGSLFVAGQYGANLVLMAEEAIIYLASASSGYTEEVLDSGLLQHLDNHLVGFGHWGSPLMWGSYGG